MIISIVVPMYNAKDTILNSIKSIESQSYKGDIEIIIVNDGSTDNCEKLVEEYLLNYQSNIKIKLISKINGGVSSARNVGIRESSGDWIGFLDSDDVWLPKKLQMQIDEINRNSKIKFIGSNRNGEIYPFFRKSQTKLYILKTKDILAKWYPHTSTALIKKELLFLTKGYDEQRTHAEDGDLWLKISQYEDLYVLNENLVFTGAGKRSFGESGLSANMPKMYEGELLALNGALTRKQIHFFEYCLFYTWLSIKYLRRIWIVKRSK